MAERTAPIPNLSRLALHEESSVGMQQGNAQETPLRDLPPEIWRMIVEFSHAPVDRDNGPEINVTCARLTNACKVAKNAPWGSQDATCGPNGFLYDRANALMGFYRDANDWQAFSAWATLQPQVPGNQTWLANPRAYFRKCCQEFDSRVTAYGDDLATAFRNILLGTHRTIHSWTRALLEYMLWRDPRLFRLMPSTDRLTTGPAFLRDDYTYLAKIALALDGRVLQYVPGALRWRIVNDDVYTRVGAVNAYYTDAEFAELAWIAIRSKENAGSALQYVPGAMDRRNTVRSQPVNPQFVALAREAVQRNASALDRVPGNISLDGYYDDYNPDYLHPPIEEYVELATLAVKKQPIALQRVPGVLWEPESTTQRDYPTWKDRMRNDWNGGGWVQTNQGTLTDDDFIAIAKAAIEEARSRGGSNPWSYNDDVYFCIPPRLRLRGLGATLLAEAQQRYA